MRVAVSGTGRIGRLCLRKALSLKSPEIEISVINSTSPISVLAHLLKYDSVHGIWDAEIASDDRHLIVRGRRIPVVSERSPELLPWEAYGIDLVVDATGKFNEREKAARHFAAGAKKVLLTAPAGNADLTVVMGVNEHEYDPARHRILSAASCTTNCIAPVLRILDDAFGVKQGWMTTIHAFTNDQNHLDNPHKDLRRARACTNSIIPTSTGVGKALSGILPHLAPYIEGISVRVPTQDVSLLDLQVQLHRNVERAEVRKAIEDAVSGEIGKYVDYNEIPLVSSDYIGNDKSAVIDGLSLMVRDDQVKLLAWYDNEWAYASRVIDFTVYAARAESTDNNPGALFQSSAL
jgi:glyceraldehyde 3-phosphate dehydrogenase